jgi:hypothetical protein
MALKSGFTRNPQAPEVIAPGQMPLGCIVFGAGRKKGGPVAALRRAIVRWTAGSVAGRE